ncbi:MAG: hypothetical protein WC670_05940 [Pseudolabrys sp.]|jgi:chromosome segregation ATPase
MQPAKSPLGSADTPPPIDELAERLTALANRIDTLNGGRKPSRATAAAPRGAPVRRAEPQVPAVAAAERAVQDRQWPRIPVPGDPRLLEMQDKLADQDAALQERGRQIAELAVIKERQAHELQRAHELIERHTQSINALRELASRGDGDVAELTRKLADTENQKMALESQLASALREANTSSVRLMSNEGALNSKDADLAEAHDLIEDLRVKLSAALAATATQVATAEERLQRRYEAERGLHIDNTERRFADLQALIAQRDARVAELEQANVALTDEVTSLAGQLKECRGELAAATETVSARNSHIAFLDTVIKVTRDNSEATVRELVAEFDRERDEIAARMQASSALQMDIVRLLPRLLERRGSAAA